MNLFLPVKLFNLRIFEFEPVVIICGAPAVFVRYAYLMDLIGVGLSFQPLFCHSRVLGRGVCWWTSLLVGEKTWAYVFRGS